MTTVAVVGIGRWGKNLVRSFDKVAQVKYCCHTGTSSNGKWVREQYPKIILTSDYARILEDQDVDAVVIAVPVEVHASLVKKAIQADKDVFVEKPLASSTRAARKLVKLANQRQCRLFTGYIFIYAPALRELFNRTRDDPVTHLRVIWEKFGTFTEPLKYTLACHDIAIAHHLYGDQLQVECVVERTGIKTECDLLSVLYQTPKGRSLTASYDRTSNRQYKSIVAVTQSGNRYGFIDDELLKLENGEHRNITPPNAEEPLLAECRAFIDWIKGKKSPPSGGAFGAEVNAVLEQL